MRASAPLASALLSVTLGCTGTTEGAHLVVGAPTPLGGRSAAMDDPPALAPASRVLTRHATVLIGAPAPPPGPTRPPSRGRVDLSLSRAELANALRLIADAGRFNLVLEDGLSGSVTTVLRGVDAFDALVAIVGANGGEVRYERGIVTVRKGR